MTELLAAALGYAARGWPVFPLRPPLNAPLFASAHPDGDPLRGKCKGECGQLGHGFYDAASDPAAVERWWTTTPSANIGVRTGVAFDVLDVDHDDYVTGVAALPDCETDGGPVVRTGAGRFHLYFAPTGLGRRIKFSKHCDWLGTDGYVVAPPSTHRRGGRYEWFAPPDLELRAPPPELVAAVDPPPPPRPPWAPDRGLPRLGGWSPAGLVRVVAAAPEGARNNALNWAAHRLGTDIHAGRAPQQVGLAVLDDLADTARQAGLGDGEIDKTIRSGYRAGLDGRAK